MYLPIVPPHNIEAEQAVLGAILIDQDALTSASELLVPDSFYRTKHQKILKSCFGHLIRESIDSSNDDISNG